jgi:branched-chain amino acid transport system permease protein
MMGRGRLAAWGIGLAALVALPFVYRDPYHLHILVLILIWSFAYTSWSMMGRFGLVSLGHGGFMGIGAYVTALLWNHLGWSPWIGIPIGMVAAGALALIVGYPCFRFRITGHYFVLVTLALSGIVLQVITATRDYTGGSLGYTPNRAAGNKLWSLQFDDKITWYLIALGVWLFGIVVWHWVDRSMARYALEAISEDEDAAAAAGVDVTAEKLKITLLSALMTALAGYRQRHRGVAPDGVRGHRRRPVRLARPDLRRRHHDYAGRDPAHRLRYQGGRLGQSRLRRAARAFHHIPSEGHPW